MAADTCFAQLRPKTIPSPILLCNPLPAGARAGPAATSPSTLICSGSGRTLYKASSRRPGPPARAKGFFFQPLAQQRRELGPFCFAN